MRKIKVKSSQINVPLNKFSNKPDATETKLLPISWLTRVFGCWHKKMGSPFTRGNQTYCTCMLCGACQKFDVKLWKNTGPFYYNPILALYDFHSEKTYSSENCRKIK
jgi:hypothetical protein